MRLLAVAVAIVALAGGAVALVRRGAVDELVAFAVAIAAFGGASRSGASPSVRGSRSRRPLGQWRRHRSRSERSC